MIKRFLRRWLFLDAIRHNVNRTRGLLSLCVTASRPRALSVQALKNIVADGTAWRATSGDPQLCLSSTGLQVRGLCLVQLSIAVKQPLVRASLYFDTGRGYFESQATHVVFRSGERAWVQIYLPLSARRLRLDPCDVQGPVRILAVEVTPLGLSATLRHVFRERMERGPLRARGLARLRRGLGLTESTDYEQFLRATEPALASVRKPVTQHIETFGRKPTISIIMPTWNTDPDLLEKAVASVRAQVYPHWQLCIADDASTLTATRECLKKLAASDRRITLSWCEDNVGISAASNQALATAEGEFVGFLDHDDELSPLALYHVAAELDRQPGLDLIYSDEDKLDDRGRRVEPHLKPAWNPELLHGQNYITHLAVYRTQIVRELGGLRSECDGSQDHDLALRFEKIADPAKVRHIPVVLYHWRAVEGSTAVARDAKDYAHGAGERALRDRFSGDELARVGKGEIPLTYRVDYGLPTPAPKLSVIIPTRDGYAHASRCLQSILDKTVYPDYEILLIDNQSRDPETLDWLTRCRELKSVRVLEFDQAFNYSAINNFAAAQARGEILLLLNDDTEVITPDWMSEMASLALRPDVGAVGAKLHYPDGSIQHAGVALGIGGVAGHTHWRFSEDAVGYLGRLKVRQAVSAVTAACLAVSREKFLAVGGLNETNLAIAFNDVDLCLKLSEAGFRNVWTPFARLYHHESISRGAEDTPEKMDRFRLESDWMKARWGNLLDADPFYHRCFSRTAQDMSLAPRPQPYRPWEGQW